MEKNVIFSIRIKKRLLNRLVKLCKASYLTKNKAINVAVEQFCTRRESLITLLKFDKNFTDKEDRIIDTFIKNLLLPDQGVHNKKSVSKSSVKPPESC